jgi:hypothetical protein
VVAPFKAVDCYATLRAKTASGGEGTLFRIALLGPALESVRYTYERRLGCGDAFLVAHLSPTSPEFKTLERLRDVDEVTIFARDPQSTAQASYPHEPVPAFDSSVHVRVWTGRLAAVRFDPIRAGRIEIEAEGYVRILDETQATAAGVSSLFLGKTISEIASALFPVSGVFGTEIETGGRMSTLLDEFDAAGQTKRGVIDALAEIGGPMIDWGVDRRRFFWMRSRNNPFHQPADYLDTVGAETDLEDVSLQRDLRGVKSVVQVFGAKSSATGPRISGLFTSNLGVTKYGARQEDVVRDDVRNFFTLSTVGRAILRERLTVPTRVRATIPADVRYRLDEKALRPVVVRIGRQTPVSYMSVQTAQPTNSPSGFALRLTRAGSGVIVVVHPATIPLVAPYLCEVVRKQKSNPTVGQRFTILSSAISTSSTTPTFRLVVVNPAGTVRVDLEAWNGTSVVTVVSYTPPASLVDVTAAFAGEILAGSGKIWRDGVVVASAAAAGVGFSSGGLSVVGANESATADFDDAEVCEVAFWINVAARDNTHPIWALVGAHTSALGRLTTEIGKVINIVYIPFWEGVGGLGLETKGNFSGNPQAVSKSLIFGTTSWVAGLVAHAAGGTLSPLAFDASWGDGDLYGGSPIVYPDSLEREWRDADGWRTEIEGALADSSISRPIAEIEARLAALENARKTETGSISSPALS